VDCTSLPLFKDVDKVLAAWRKLDAASAEIYEMVHGR
jgi:hypothetical protein